MDDNYLTLKRPKRKLSYSTTNTRLNQCTPKTMTGDDVDKIFDELDSNGSDDFPSPPHEIYIGVKNKRVGRDVTPVLLKEHHLKEQTTCQNVANGDHSPLRQILTSPDRDIDSGIPFEAHGPVKTSSPNDGNAIQHKHKEKAFNDNSAIPILFDCEEEAKQFSGPADKPENPQHTDYRRDETDDSMFETLLKTSGFTKTSTQKKSAPPKRKNATSPTISPERPGTTSGAPEKQTESAQIPSRVNRTMSSFLQKLRDAGLSKPSAGMSHPKVMSPPSELEDEFLFLEDDAPLYVSIPRKSSKSLKKKHIQTSSSDKETKNTFREGQFKDKQLDTKPQSKKQESQTLNENSKKKAKGDKVTKSHSDESSVEKKGSKSLQIKKQNVENNRTLELKKSRKAAHNHKAVTDVMKEQGRNQESTGEDPVNNDDLDSEDSSNLETDLTKDITDVNLKQKIPSSSVKATSDETGIVLGKRKRRQTGEWWKCHPQSSEQQPTDKQPTIKKDKQVKKNFGGAAAPPVKATTGGRKKNLIDTSSSSSDNQKQQADKKEVKNSKINAAKGEGPTKTNQIVVSAEVLAAPIQDRALDQDSDSDSTPLLLQHREPNMSSGDQIFHKVYQKSSNEKVSFPSEHAAFMRPEEQRSSREATKLKTKSPGNRWQMNPTPDDQEFASSQLQQLSPKKSKIKTVWEKKMLVKRPTAHTPSKPLEGAPENLCSTFTVNPPERKETETNFKRQQNETSPSAENTEAQYNVVIMETSTFRGVHDRSKVLMSGPSSMIEIENNEEDYEDIDLPSTTVPPALCVSDLCAPPLRSLALQPKDKANLQEFLKDLWSTTDSGTEITPDDFAWYCYQDRAIGLMVDVQSGSIINGKMLLGSLMKKPLWVDHSATTVFNVLTSSVSVIDDCKKSCYNAGQSFMVPCGHAYSIHNLSTQPAVLYFTRIFDQEPGV